MQNPFANFICNPESRDYIMASGAGSGDRALLKPARPIGLQVKHLEALMAIAVEGSFGAAARRLGYTQSAVSQQIAALERLVGQRLVDRSKSADPPRLTPAGRLLLEHAETIMSVVYAAEADLVASRRPPCLRLGAIRSVAAVLLPAALKRFRESYPEESIEFLERASSDELVELVERGALDAAFAARPTAAGPFDVHLVLTQRFVVAVPTDSEPARKGRPIAIRELGSLPLIGTGEAHVPDTGTNNVRSAFKEVDSRTLLAFVRAGLGAALVPELAIESDDRSVVALPVADAIAPQQVVLVTHRPRRTQLPLEWLEDLARTVGRDLVRSRGAPASPRVRRRRGQTPLVEA
jgi:DNA-binding transcriptional LysR family regulator